MRERVVREFPRSLGLLLARLPLGLYFALAGLGKLVKVGVGPFVEQNLSHVPGFLPQYLGRSFLYLLPWFEILVGLLLVLGLFTRVAGFIAALLLISFTVAYTGVQLGLGGAPFHYNIVFLGVALMLFLAGAGEYSLDDKLFSRREVVRVDEEPAAAD